MSPASQSPDKTADPLFTSANEPIPRAERWIAALLLLAAFALRCFYIFRFRYDSDEPQHLHTTWGWTQGLLQYRDFFDNHTPLFHLLFSPLVAALGERADILTYMRFAMIPLWLVALWAVWRIGSRLFSPRAGLWATVFIALLSWWFFCALEYRTDNLWTPLWLCTLAVLLTGPLTWKRAFAGGLLLGLCCAVSMKTSLLLSVSALAAAFSPHLCAGRFDRAALGRELKIAFPLLAGLLVIPALVCAFFAAKGCWAEFYYCVIQHNVMPNVDAKLHPWYDRLAFPVALPFLLYGASRIARHSADPSLALRRSFLFLWAGLYYAALYSFWALLTRQDYLPFYPIVALLAAPFILWRVKTPSRQTVTLTAVAVVETALILGGRPPWIDGTREKREVLRQVIQLTRPGEYVMDFKGESVFRRRAYYYVLEPLTVRRMKLKMIADTIPHDLAEKKVHLVVNRDRAWYLPPTKQFLTENYLSIGQVRVAGRILSSTPTTPGAMIDFPVEIPARYVLWADGSPVQGLLDGQPYDGARELAPGLHHFQPESGSPRLALLWERAAQAGYSPLLDSPGWLVEP